MPNRTILIVDDDLEILTFYQKIFSPSSGSEFQMLPTPDAASVSDLKALTFSNPLGFEGTRGARGR